MRLTLRTLLAYMDDILDPADQEELGRKIESSPFATELIHRTRDAVRRLRLSAPEPTAGGDDDVHGDDNLDANTVAAYLDNVLSPESVAEFERACLEAGANADMLLAEAASCHHVLTMVLGEPAEVDSDLRRRLYALAQSPAAEPQVPLESPAGTIPPAAAAEVGAAASAPPGPVTLAPRHAVDRDESAVPDYLRVAARERRRTRRNVSLFVTAVLAGVVGTWLLWPQGPVEVPRELAESGGADRATEGFEVGETEPAGSAATADATGATPDADVSEADAPRFVPPVANPESDPATATPAPAAADIPPVLPPESGESIGPPDSGGPSTPPVTTDPLGADPLGEGAVPAPPLEGAAAVPPGDMATGPDLEAATAPAEGTGPPATPDEAALAAANTGPPLPALPPDSAVPPPADLSSDVAAAGPTLVSDASTAAPANGAEPPPVAVPPVAEAGKPKPVGHYLGNNDLLLRQQEGDWARLAPRTPLGVGDQVLSLPSFRTHVVVADVNAYLVGGTQLGLMPPAEPSAGKPAELTLHVPYGQLILNAGLNGNRIELSLVDETRVLDLGPSSSLALDVQRPFAPGGADRQPAPVVVTWYLTSGKVSWGEALAADAPATWTTAGGEDSVATPLEKAPEWVDRDPVTGLERGARDDVAAALAPGEPVYIRLLELSDRTGLGRRVEVRTLAAQSGAYVGVYDPLVRALGEIDERPRWDDHIETLRQAIARDPAAIDGIQEALVAQRGEPAANDLMEMLLGFDRAAVGATREEVQQGVLVRLLRWMNDDDLTYRVLASYNVNEITGTNYLGNYRPQHTAAQRERSLRHYWQRLENGELLPKPAS